METMILIFLFVFTGITYGLQFQEIRNYTVCNFEQKNLCGFTKDEIKKAEFDWTWYSGSTPSNGTGPSADHTTGTSAGHYMYIETSDPRKPDEAARIMSPLYFPIDRGPQCVTFWYHMYGADVNALVVYMIAEDVTGLIWTRSFDHGDKWHAAFVTVKPGGYFQTEGKCKGLLFEGHRGDGSRGDIAIDDVSVANGACKVKDEHFVDCGFEYGFCAWRPIIIDPLLHPLLNWARTSDYDPYKGQSGDGKGSYIYTRSSDTLLSFFGYLSATLISPPLPKTSEKGSCFSLWYRIPESSVGRLSIYTFTNNAAPQLHLQWNKSDSQSNEWQQVALNIVQSTAYKLLIDVDKPRFSDFGSIAIDDTRFEDIPCGSSSRGKQSGLKTTNIHTIDNYTVCDFEQHNLCGFTQDEIRKAEFNWTWHSGSTASRGTGPSADHTKGTSAGHYIYIETSDPRKPNEAARILSHGYRAKSTGSHCVTFWYHMYGADVNTLNVYLFAEYEISAKTLIWSRSLNQGNGWKQAAVTVKPDGDFQLLFEGVRGNGFQGDIAVDDVSVAIGTCRWQGGTQWLPRQ